ncbi:MAG TPA: penicillin-binding transpeptidase domain-containing protein [Polyangiaceae bacterium]|nr:penicillin-binding transpeptidase domain-containing protein [Polyangiaceae bacterium]
MSSLQTERGRWIRMRMGVLCGGLALALGLLVAGGWDLMVQDGAAWRELAEKQRQRRLHVVPKRGTIYDRNGGALAVSVEVPSVSMDAVELLRGVSPQKIPVVARDAANRIGRVLSIDPARVERKILAKRRFTWLKRRITAKEADEIRALGSAEGDRRVRGLVVEGEGRRYHPRRELLGPLLGFVAPDGEGKDGLELSMNKELKGHVEQLRGLRDRSGRLLFADGVQDEQALAGHNLYLTIDQGIQYVAERELSAAARTFEAAGGSVVVVDPKTGELLAMASWPGYNPNDYTESEPGQRRDRSVTDVFEPGSTMKIFTVAAGLSTGVITPTQKLYCEKGAMRVDNVVIRDTHPAEWLTISRILAISSNICSAKIGISMGGDKLYEAFRRFGFGQETGVPLPGESSGTLRPRGRSWVQVETAAAAFGQGISVTNLQMAMAVAAVANGGELLQPSIIKKVTTATGEVVREHSPLVRRRVVPRWVARAMAEMLVAVTEGEGTGVEAAIDGYQVAGKTATAQKTDPATGRYSLDKYIASFVGFVPANDPVVAIAVTIDEPMVDHAGGSVAAPVFRRVAQMALKYRGLTPRQSDRVDVAELSTRPDPAHLAYEVLRQREGKAPPVQVVAATKQAVSDGKVRLPDMTGWPVRQAIKHAVELGLSPTVEGTGLLARQQPGPGEVADKGTNLLLVFEPAS